MFHYQYSFCCICCQKIRDIIFYTFCDNRQLGNLSTIFGAGISDILIISCRDVSLITFQILNAIENHIVFSVTQYNSKSSCSVLLIGDGWICFPLCVCVKLNVGHCRYGSMVPVCTVAILSSWFSLVYPPCSMLLTLPLMVHHWIVCVQKQL